MIKKTIKNEKLFGKNIPTEIIQYWSKNIRSDLSYYTSALSDTIYLMDEYGNQKTFARRYHHPKMKWEFYHYSGESLTIFSEAQFLGFIKFPAFL